MAATKLGLRQLPGTPANGQTLIGNGTGFSIAALTQGNGVTITNGAGSITVAANINTTNLRFIGGAIDTIQSIATDTVPTFLSLSLTAPLPVGSGGTGNASYTVGDILYASAADVLSIIAGVATGNALISGGVGAAPSWGKIGLTTHVSGVLGVSNGGSGTNAAFTAGSVVFAGASGVYTRDAKLFWDNTNKRLGVGLTSPGYDIDVLGTDPRIRIQTTSGTGGPYLALEHNASDGGHKYWIGSSGSTNASGAGFLEIADVTSSALVRMKIDSGGSVIIGSGALATNTTSGFLYLPTCAGTPTGTPTSYTGEAPVLVDTTGTKLWARFGGTWKSVTFV
jgi:hypothetical protein